MKTSTSIRLSDPASPAPCPSVSFANNLSRAGNTTTDGGFGGAIEDNTGANLAVLSCSFTGNQTNGGGVRVRRGHR